ncbi:site-specific integrase [Nocardioides litoris]|uniref:site-specific integrase n=1 Tax=Nocardioides litoris TaxID=1926648 RepID=UPI0014775FD7|nr:tyrosine-type recombinase/integrase [Nocardioides litoris]
MPTVPGRPRLAPGGEHGEPWTERLKNGTYRARVRLRDRDGKAREVTARATTKSGALRELQRRIDARQQVVTSQQGVTANMTVADLGAYWLQHRSRPGRQRSRAAVKPQTLAGYASVLRLLIEPHIGGVRLSELSVGLLENVLGDIEDCGISTDQMRTVLQQCLDLAVRHEALASNPMRLVDKPARNDHEVQALTIDQVHDLRVLVDPVVRKQPGKRGPNRDLADLIDLGLGTGCRIGELLALTWDRFDLESSTPTARIDGTIVEPRAGYVDSLHRQDSTKTGGVRTLVLPDAVVARLQERRSQVTSIEPTDPVLASSKGTLLWPNNLRTRLRAAVAGTDLEGTTPHTLRRTVGTLVAHERGLDAARDQLGHSDGSVTWKSYVASRDQAPDLRDLLDQFFD